MDCRDPLSGFFAVHRQRSAALRERLVRDAPQPSKDAAALVASSGISISNTAGPTA